MPRERELARICAHRDPDSPAVVQQGVEGIVLLRRYSKWRALHTRVVGTGEARPSAEPKALNEGWGPRRTCSDGGREAQPPFRKPSPKALNEGWGPRRTCSDGGREAQPPFRKPSPKALNEGWGPRRTCSDGGREAQPPFRKPSPKALNEGWGPRRTCSDGSEAQPGASTRTFGAARLLDLAHRSRPRCLRRDGARRSAHGLSRAHAR